MSSSKVYTEGLLGKKLGMTQVFKEDGSCVPVTAIEVGPCYVLQVNRQEGRGYNSVQLGFSPKKAQRITKAQMGHFAVAGKGGFYHVKELRCDVDALGWTELGQELKVDDVFNEGQIVDVTGVSKGKGFSGVVRRYGVGGQPATRGTHKHRRNVGSVGCRKPNRIWKNHKMPGQLGNKRVTVQNLEVVGVRADDNVLLVKGAVPGGKGTLIVVRKAVKHHLKQEKAA